MHACEKRVLPKWTELLLSQVFYSSWGLIMCIQIIHAYERLFQLNSPSPSSSQINFLISTWQIMVQKSRTTYMENSELSSSYHHHIHLTWCFSRRLSNKKPSTPHHQKIQPTTVEGPIHESCLLLPIATWFGAPRRHCANLPYRRQTCHLQLGWLFIPVEAYTTSVTLESCFHSRCCWWGHPRLPGPRKKVEYILHLLNHGSFLPPKDTTHIGRGSASSWEKPDMFLTERIICLHDPA